MMSGENEATNEILQRVDAAGVWAKDAIEQIATQLGVTAQELWPAFVRKAIAIGIKEISIGIIVLLFAAFIGWKFILLSKKLTGTESDDSGLPAFVFIVALIIWGGGISIFTSFFGNDVNAFFCAGGN